MKPERINVAPWITEWQASAPSYSKAFTFDSSADAQYYAEHIQRIAALDDTSEVKTSISEDHVVVARIFAVQGEALTSAQEELSQRIDESLFYLQQAPEPLN